jgi:hypothetical protein
VAGYVESIGRMKNACKLSVWRPEERILNKYECESVWTWFIT